MFVIVSVMIFVHSVGQSVWCVVEKKNIIFKMLRSLRDLIAMKPSPWFHSMSKISLNATQLGLSNG